MTRIAVLVSGSGTILQAMIEKGVPISLVLADKSCKALDIAARAGIPTSTVYRTAFGYEQGIGEAWDREGFTESVLQQLEGESIDVVAMAGFFTILHPVFFDRYNRRVLNIHPALLPAFKGATAVADALAAGVKITGTTVHIATERLDDERYIVDQIEVPVEDGDTVDELWERIKEQERELYPRVLMDILSGKINLDDIKERVADAEV